MNTTSTKAIQQHWPEYLMEAWGLGVFMLSACLFTALLQHPRSPAYSAIGNVFVRRILIGIAMGLTAITIIHSPWGKRSGAHLNPSLTWTFFRLGKIDKWDAIFYTTAQFAGGVIGVLIASITLRMAISHPAVRYAVTIPGDAGPGLAFVAEVGISFFLMFTILSVSNHPKFSHLTSYFAGALIATYIAFESPISGMSMNPARTFASAFPAANWTSIWIYFTAPPLGMLLAAEIYVRSKGIKNIFCAKLHHHNEQRCIFNCNFAELKQQRV